MIRLSDLFLLTVSLCVITALSPDWAESVLRELDVIDEGVDKRASKKRCGAENTNAVYWTDRSDARFRELVSNVSYANWNYVTHMTKLNARQVEDLQSELVLWFKLNVVTAHRFLRNADGICHGVTVRLLRKLVNYQLIPAPVNPTTHRLISYLVNSMQRIYGSTAVVDEEHGMKRYRLNPELTRLMATSRDYDERQWAWTEWHDVVGRQIRPLFIELVVKMNEAATDNGYRDISEAWQVSDFDSTDVEATMDRLYQQIRPLYRQLHAYVRRRLVDYYRHRDLNSSGSIPAHLLGDMWAQDWTSIVDILLPGDTYKPAEMNAALRRAGYSVRKMFRLAEEFFTSLGFERMTVDFWRRSVFARPDGNWLMDCHASAHDFFTEKDFRVKMCAEVSVADLQTIHHELGHVVYFMQYRDQPALFRTGANAAFHEAVGDTVAMSVMTPQHWRSVVLGRRLPAPRPKHVPDTEMNFLLRLALSRVALLPYAYALEKWRYEVFRGDVAPSQYNARYWQLRQKYQGVRAPAVRDAESFDPGAKFHVAANVPYSRYFVSAVMQFQLHAALCRAKRHIAPPHTCDIYGSPAAGHRLRTVLSLGASRPWPEVMKIITGYRDIRADRLVEYFRPLLAWLRQQNRGHPVGW